MCRYGEVVIKRHDGTTTGYTGVAERTLDEIQRILENRQAEERRAEIAELFTSGEFISAYASGRLSEELYKEVNNEDV